MATGFKTIDGYKYYFDSNGHRLTGWFTINGQTYYAFKHSGSVKYPVKCVEAIANEAFWGDYESPSEYDWQPEGSLVTDHYCKINGNWYFFNSNSVMVTGLMQVYGGYNYFESNGIMRTYGTIWIDEEPYVHFNYGRFVPGEQLADSPNTVGSDIPTT